jgi:hypothetical protein
MPPADGPISYGRPIALTLDHNLIIGKPQMLERRDSFPDLNYRVQPLGVLGYSLF